MNHLYLMMSLMLLSMTATAQTADNNSIKALWALTTGTGTETAAVAPAEDGASFIRTTEMTVGSELTVKPESGDNPIATTYDGYSQTFFRQGSKTSSATDNNAITFLLQTKEGITFTPTKVGLKIARWLTDKCKVDVSWVNDDGTKLVLASGITPNRNYNPDKGTGDIEGCSILDYDVASSKANEGRCGIRINVYGMKLEGSYNVIERCNFYRCGDTGLQLGFDKGGDGENNRNPKYLYGIGLASKAVVFAEGNFFRNCKYPVISSAQGTDKNLVNAKESKKGLLSGEDSGICKFFNNHIEGAKSFITQLDNSATKFDAYVVESRDEKIPSTITGLTGGAIYSNFDTGDFYHCTPLEPADVPEAVTGQYGAGRCQKGDFKWTFNNAVDDASCDLNTQLKAALEAYRSSWVGFFDGTDLTGVESVMVDSLGDDDAIYDLAGRKVSTNCRGIVIKNGRKVLNK